MGIRQKESDFRYETKMNFIPKQVGEEAGVSIFQQDDNYIMFTIHKTESGSHLKLYVKEQKLPIEVISDELLSDYKGEIVFRITANQEAYRYYYSLDDGDSFKLFSSTSTDLVLCFGYTGAYVGLYATSNGTTSDRFADFDWMHYKGFTKN